MTLALMTTFGLALLTWIIIANVNTYRVRRRMDRMFGQKERHS